MAPMLSPDQHGGVIQTFEANMLMWLFLVGWLKHFEQMNSIWWLNLPSLKALVESMIFLFQRWNILSCLEGIPINLIKLNDHFPIRKPRTVCKLSLKKRQRGWILIITRCPRLERMARIFLDDFCLVGIQKFHLKNNSFQSWKKTTFSQQIIHKICVIINYSNYTHSISM